MTAESRAPSSLRLDLVALGVVCVVAAVLRFWGLGSLSLQVDEGVQGLAVQGWLKEGLPILPSGMMYQRSIPFGALQALAASAFGLDEFALRLPAAFFGVLSVLATFALGHALFGRRVAWIAAVFIALSAWEVELSRYGRFYTAFQVTYLLALLCFYKALRPGAHAWRWGFGLAALLATSFHELSIVLATCFLIPLFDRTASPRTRVISLSCLIPFAAGWVMYRRGFTRWFAGLAPPHGLEEMEPVGSEDSLLTLLPGFPDLRFPPHALIDFSAMAERLALVGALLVGTVFTIVILRKTSRDWRQALLVLAIAFGVLHQFMLALLALLAHLLLSANSLSALWGRRMWPVHGALLTLLALWTAVLLPRVEGSAKALVLALFGFPNLFQHFVYWFVLGWPLFLVAIIGFGALLISRFVADGDRAKVFLVISIIAPMALASVFDAYFESRYVFHLYPLLTILFAWGLGEVWDRQRILLPASGFRQALVTGIALALCFAASGDVGPRSWGPMRRTYASPRDPMRAVISWRAYSGFQQDQAGVSRAVVERLGPDDVVAAIGVPHQLAVYRFYMGRLDIALGRPQDAGYHRRHGTEIIDRVTGSTLVFDPMGLVTPGRRTWLVGDEILLRDELDYFAPEVEREARALARDVDVLGRDGVSFAKRFY
jgi:4-amino-4-deoxy-L-arabinose transferase-like glycosyltransferase